MREGEERGEEGSEGIRDFGDETAGEDVVCLEDLEGVGVSGVAGMRGWGDEL